MIKYFNKVAIKKEQMRKSQGVGEREQLELKKEQVTLK